MQIRLADRRGILKGELNPLQNYALQIALLEEDKVTFEAEENRMRYTLLASNPELYKKIFRDPVVEEDEVGVEWITPESAEDVDFILEDYARVQSESVPIESVKTS